MGIFLILVALLKKNSLGSIKKLQGKNTNININLTAIHKKKPFQAPNKVGESRHKNIGPGIANACKSIYKYTNANTV